MSSHNTSTDTKVQKEPVKGETDLRNIRVIDAKLDIDAELSIADDADLGVDPYNSTGQHAILKAKKPLDR